MSSESFGFILTFMISKRKVWLWKQGNQVPANESWNIPSICLYHSTKSTHYKSSCVPQCRYSHVKENQWNNKFVRITEIKILKYPCSKCEDYRVFPNPFSTFSSLLSSSLPAYPPHLLLSAFLHPSSSLFTLFLALWNINLLCISGWPVYLILASSQNTLSLSF